MIAIPCKLIVDILKTIKAIEPFPWTASGVVLRLHVRNEFREEIKSRCLLRGKWECLRWWKNDQKSKLCFLGDRTDNISYASHFSLAYGLHFSCCYIDRKLSVLNDLVLYFCEDTKSVNIMLIQICYVVNSITVNKTSADDWTISSVIFKQYSAYFILWEK